MRIALAQQNFIIGNFAGNEKLHLSAIQEAVRQYAELIVFPELSVCGYPPHDLLSYPAFVERSWQMVEALREHSRNIAIVVGAPVTVEGRLHNCLVVLNGGKHQLITGPRSTVTDVFDDERYFAPTEDAPAVEINGKRVNFLRGIPAKGLMNQEADLTVISDASVFYTGVDSERKARLSALAVAGWQPVLYVNHIGGNGEIIFDGGSMAFDAGGTLRAEAAYFVEGVSVVDVDDSFLDTQTFTGTYSAQEEDVAKIHDALVLGIRDYFRKNGLKKALLGLSGGIDSALTMALAVRALGAENVRGVLMPSQFSTGHSVDDARQLAENLGSPYDIIAIKPMYDEFMTHLGPRFEGKPFDTTEENIQARVRAVLLMGLANKLGFVVLNTSNKSESAVGYGTIYGDLVGGLAVLADIYKTMVYRVSAYVNKDAEVIPLNSITKPPSAELRPDQKDSDSLPEYDVLDRILYGLIEERKDSKQLVAEGNDPAVVERVLKLIMNSEWKRYQTAPALRVSRRPFGQGWRMPLVARFTL